MKTITEEEFMKDIGHGVERTQENWKEKFNTFFGYASKMEIEDFISTLLAEERELQNKLKEIAINNLITDVNTARKEERQFVLNILDGIDIADKEMGVTGGTQAIRQALQSRI